MRCRPSLARLAALVALSACAHGSRPVPAAVPSPQATTADTCVLVPPPAGAPESLTVAVTEPVNPAHAPWPRNAGERFVFAQLYETLLGTDCGGALRPGLADEWSVDSTGRNLTITLAHRVWSATRDTLAVVDVVRRGMRPSLGITLGGSSYSARDLLVHLHDSMGETDTVLADPSTATVRAVPGTPWPEGTGGYLAQQTSARVVRLEPVVDARPVLIVHDVTERAARDAIDEGVDLLITRDPAAVHYAATRDDLISIPLPWDREYVLLLPHRGSVSVVSTSTSAPAPAGDPIAALRGALARDAVRVEARPAQTPSWWNALPGCPSLTSLAASMAPAGHVERAVQRLVYPRDDATARAIAERLVALSSTHDPTLATLAPSLTTSTPPLAEPMDSASFEHALAAGSDVGYVLLVPAQTLWPCGATALLLARAPWLASDSTTLADRILSLVDTRPRAIVRRGVVGVRIDGVGALYVLPRASSSP